MHSVTERAPAKLNLYLHVTGRRADGYHELESLVVFADLADTLLVVDDEKLSLTVDGEFATQAGNNDDNLVFRASRLLQSATGTAKGAAITLTKNIPVGAGLGGGSADAAATLRVLNRFWALGLSEAELHALAVTLGADVAMCLTSTPAIARGVGEMLTPLSTPLPPLHTVLVYPHTPLLTAEVFKALDIQSLPVTHAEMRKVDLPTLIQRTRNDLQRPAITLCPQVAEVLLALGTVFPPAILTRMTGSGACCFALYANKEAAAKAAADLSERYPDWWVTVTLIPSAVNGRGLG